MDKTTTKILFSIDKFVNAEEVLQAAVAVAKRSMVALEYVQTDDSISLGSGHQDDVKREFKSKHGVELGITIEPGGFWKSLTKAAEKLGATLVVIGAQAVKSGLLGGGMTSKVSGFDCPVLYLNSNSTWQTPNDIIMPVDWNSETRQKFSPVAHWAKVFYSNVHVIGVKRTEGGEEAKMSHIYAIQGHNHMVEKGLRPKIEELEANSDIVATCMNYTNTCRSKWLSVLNTSEGILRVSAFQKVCEEATFPLLIVPYREPVGLGGSGY